MRAPKAWPVWGLAVAATALGVWGWRGAGPGGRPGECTPDPAAARALDRERADLQHVQAAKEALLADLRAGRVTLATAADVYYAMVVACQRLLDGLRFSVPDAGSDLERVSLRLSQHAVQRADPADRDGLADRFNAEHRDRFPAGTPPFPLALGGQ